MEPEEYERMERAEEAHWWYAGMRSISFALLANRLPPGGGARVLDAGCGTGGMLLHLAQRGRAVGIDQAAEAVRGCRRRGVRAARAEVGALPFADASFDAVTCFDVLYHRRVGDDRAAARELARVLRPGGVLLVRVPALPILWGAHDEAVHGRHRYVRGELAGLLAGAGLEVVRTTYANGLLLPLVLLRRSLDRLTGRAGSDVGPVPPLLDRALRAVLELEARWVRRFSLPLGSSLFALARRPG